MLSSSLRLRLVAARLSRHSELEQWGERMVVAAALADVLDGDDPA
jgi:hypothetical protein